MLSSGLWYRGLPLKIEFSGNLRNESAALMLGCVIPGKNLKINYSYDFTISKLSYSNSAGAHEINITYEFAKEGKKVRVSKGKTIKKKF
jgi:hypothetical protein